MSKNRKKEKTSCDNLCIAHKGKTWYNQCIIKKGAEKDDGSCDNVFPLLCCVRQYAVFLPCCFCDDHCGHCCGSVRFCF